MPDIPAPSDAVGYLGQPYSALNAAISFAWQELDPSTCRLVISRDGFSPPFICCCRPACLLQARNVSIRLCVTQETANHEPGRTLEEFEDDPAHNSKIATSTEEIDHEDSGLQAAAEAALEADIARSKQEDQPPSAVNEGEMSFALESENRSLLQGLGEGENQDQQGNAMPELEAPGMQEVGAGCAISLFDSLGGPIARERACFSGQGPCQGGPVVSANANGGWEAGHVP